MMFFYRFGVLFGVLSRWRGATMAAASQNRQEAGF
jgi:hypothetical protein